MSTEAAKKVERFFSKYPLRSYPKGQILIHAGDEPQHVFFLVKGNVRQYDISYRGDEIVVNVFKPGAFFPMLWALTKLPNRFFFDTDGVVEARAAPYKEVVEFLKTSPEVTFDLLTRLYMGVDGLLGRMVHLMSSSAKSRLLYELLIECRRFGKLREDGSCIVKLNEKELAARAGLSRETVSREMQKIHKDGLVDMNNGGVLIKNVDLLEKRLGLEI